MHQRAAREWQLGAEQRQILHSAYPMDTVVHGTQSALFRMTPVRIESLRDDDTGTQDVAADYA
jgi:hypothetical protein